MSQTHPSQSPQELLPRLVKPPNLELTDLEATLIQKVHRGYARINLEKEFQGGYGGTRVFLILPVKSNGASDARIVTKIGPAEALRCEHANYKQHVARGLPNSVAHIHEYYAQYGQAALNYVFMGGGTLGQTHSLEEYYQSHTAQEIINTLSGLLDRVLGERWYRQSDPYNPFFREEYGRHLPDNLETIVATVFPDLSVVASDQIKIPGVAELYPNPLKVSPDQLDQSLAGRCSLVHGDLHLRNVLVDENGQGWLIDFAKVEERHNLFDFIKLETYIRLMALGMEHGAFSWSEYAHFEQVLNTASLDQNAGPPTNVHLAKAFEVIRAIRKIAQNCMSDQRNFKNEYLPGLFLYCLATMKYYQPNKAAPTQLIFITTCVAGKCLLEKDTPATDRETETSKIEGDKRQPPLKHAPLQKGLATPQREQELEDTADGLAILGKLKDRKQLLTPTPRRPVIQPAHSQTAQVRPAPPNPNDFKKILTHLASRWPLALGLTMILGVLLGLMILAGQVIPTKTLGEGQATAMLRTRTSLPSLTPASLTPASTSILTLSKTPASLNGAGLIAFVLKRDEQANIYVINSDGSNLTQITQNVGENYDPIWSPDGTQIAFHSKRDGPDEIYVMNADGNNQIRLTHDAKDNSAPTWSPDGKQITFFSNRDGNYEIYVMNRDGSDQTRLTQGSANNYNPIWSPDGKQIAFYSNRDGPDEIYIMNSDGSNQTRLTQSSNNNYNHNPVWSPDSRQIAFHSNLKGPDEIYIMNRDGTNQTRLTPKSSNNYDPTWSPDSKQIAFYSNRDGDNEIYIMNSDGTNPTNLTQNSDDDIIPHWSANGKHIVFYSNRDGNYEIYVMNSDGANPTRLTNITAEKTQLFWSSKE